MVLSWYKQKVVAILRSLLPLSEINGDVLLGLITLRFEKIGEPF